MGRKPISRGECLVEECTAVALWKGYCQGHYYRLSRYGDPLAGRPLAKQEVGELRNRLKTGYQLVYLPEHPSARKDGYILEHVHVMTEHLGRELLPHENVHHKNGVRHDNRLENLELWSTSQPAGQRVEDKVAWAMELLKLYKPDILSA